MTSLQRKQQGFTIVELLIVIVVIGILALLVITTFTGIQKKARNTERQTDVKALHGQLEAYHAQNGKYPTLANLNNSGSATAWVETNLKGLDREALRDPKQAATDFTLVGSPAANVYAYAVTPAGCDNSTTDCAGYTLTSTLEDADAFVKKSLN